ncbi:MAG: hypothetical protein LC754_07010 [Acidobacteria bacterium]|nr:hypothetical protein [Acidobacteriota bacterium]
MTGRINSKLGNAPLRDIEANPDGFDAVVSLELQGRGYEANISGHIRDQRIDGTINVKFPFAPPLKFDGTRAA